ncbi:zinc finger protein 830 [Culicoides brevitarsis]|uniref:zinc finger protein 830 n=1 Tax=Culicoides brevitarsis TaxID=469753 RepID=UPI00307B956B
MSSSSFRLRRMIKDQKAATKESPSISARINSPLAKYEAGELKCIVCDAVVRSEKAWPVHVNSKKHKENLVAAKELKEKVKNDPVLAQKVAAVKRPAVPEVVSEQPTKKLKGILKNSNRKDDEEEFETPENAKIDKSLVNISRSNGQKQEKMETEEQPTNELPDGFFDNPKEDAKAHNREFKDPNDEEWDRFQKEIKDAQTLSTQIINEEQEELTTERQMDEIDEQMRIWSRVLDLEKKKEAVVEKFKEVKHEAMEEDPQNDKSSDSEDSDVDIDEYLDWRAKKSHK